MDTDDLSEEAYQAIILEADNYNHDLTLQFGILAESCKNETDYLRKSKDLIKEIQELTDDELEEVFFGSIRNKKELYAALQTILTNISKVESIPEKKRHFDFQ